MAIPSTETKSTVTTTRKRTPRKATAAGSVPPDERHRRIEVAAYFIAEKRGFQGGSSHDDWLQAEQEIDATIGKRPLSG